MKIRVQGMLALAGVLLTAGVVFPDQQGTARDETTAVYAGEQLQDPGPSPYRGDPQGVVIYDNGPLITHPTGGAGGAAASAVQTAAGLTVYGFGQQLSANNRVADDFTVPVGQSWVLDSVVLFGYQTGATTGAPTMNNVNLQIWNGVPNATGSVVVFGDTTTNRLATSVFSNIYRVLDTGLTATNRPIFANTVTLGVTLTAGTYWLDWQTGGTLASGPWAPPISILGQTTTGNALQKIGAGAWAPLVDGTSPQGLPFVLQGPNVIVAPFANSVDAAGNGVFQPNETVVMAPTWRNNGTAPVTLTGALSAFMGPMGPTYTIVDGAASYGPIAAASNAGCGANCYSLSVAAATRPVTHWDTTVLETVNPSATTKTWTLHIGDSFTDVPASNGFYKFIETILHKNVTGGCTATTYCPTASTTRDQLAVFVLVAKEPAGFVPPACVAGSERFTDVPATSGFCKWIEELARRGVVSGCTATTYCPTAPATREQMAVFVLRTLDPALNPPACGTPRFADVPATSPFCKWIEELARRGVVAGCGGGNYCPTAAVTREQMSVFLAVTFGLVLYGL